MDGSTLTVVVGHVGLGTMMGLMWRALDRRMGRLEAQREADRTQREMQREADRTQNEQQHREIIDLLRGHGERIARIEGREEALLAG